MRASAAKPVGRVEQIGVVAVGAPEVLAPESEPRLACEPARAVAEPARDRWGARSSSVASITEHESSESWVHERRLRLSEPTTTSTSSMMQTFACT